MSILVVTKIFEHCFSKNNNNNTTTNHTTTMTDASSKLYERIFLTFLSFRDGVVHTNPSVPQEHLLEVKPADIVRWFHSKVYGLDDIVGSSKPRIRSNTLQQYKKAISAFMPDKFVGWSNAAQTGNPTRSQAVNSFIASIAKKEVRCEGAASKARQNITQDEFRRVIKTLIESDDLILKHLIPGYLKLQFHMIARLDDIANLKFANFSSSDECSTFPRVRFTWSKNIDQESNTSVQVVLGSQDPVFCCLIGVGVHLETSLQQNPHARLESFLFCFAGKGTAVPTRSKEKLSKVLLNVFKEFPKGENLGSHSFRKFPATFALRQGLHKTEVDHRGRWSQREGSAVSRVYYNSTVPYVDVKVASALSIGGPVRYDYVTDSKVDDKFILKFVAPQMSKKFKDKPVPKKSANSEILFFFIKM